MFDICQYVGLRYHKHEHRLPDFMSKISASSQQKKTQNCFNVSKSFLRNIPEVSHFKRLKRSLNSGLVSMSHHDSQVLTYENDTWHNLWKCQYGTLTVKRTNVNILVVCTDFIGHNIIVFEKKVSNCSLSAHERYKNKYVVNTDGGFNIP